MSGKPAAARYMTLTEASRVLGLPTDRASIRRLRRRLRSIEQASSRTVFVRAGGKKRARYLVTIRVLKRALPEMFEEREEAASRRRTDMAIQLVAEAVDDVREQNAVLHSRLERIARDFQRHERDSVAHRKAG